MFFQTTPPIYQAAFGGLGAPEIAVLIIVAVLLFGTGKLPQLGSSIGEALKNFKKSIKDRDDSETQSENKHDPQSANQKDKERK